MYFQDGWLAVLYTYYRKKQEKNQAHNFKVLSLGLSKQFN